MPYPDSPIAQLQVLKWSERQQIDTSFFLYTCLLSLASYADLKSLKLFILKLLMCEQFGTLFQNSVTYIHSRHTHLIGERTRALTLFLLYISIS